MYKNGHISASVAPRHLKIGRERVYAIFDHRMDLFLGRSNYVSNDIGRNHREAYNELCDYIYRSSLPYKADSVNIVFQHMLRLGSL